MGLSFALEVFFKLIKSNFKFQNLTEKSKNNNLKIYYSSLIVILILKAIENYYWKDKQPKISINLDNKIDSIEKINKSKTIKNIFIKLLDKIIYGTLNQELLDNFCKRHISTYNNKLGRSNPRRSNTPFTKWYVKDYSESSKYKKVISAIINNKINQLNKNLKTLATKITILDNG